MCRQKVRFADLQVSPSSVWRKYRQPVQIWKLYIYTIAVTMYGKIQAQKNVFSAVKSYICLHDSRYLTGITEKAEVQTWRNTQRSFLKRCYIKRFNTGGNTTKYTKE